MAGRIAAACGVLVSAVWAYILLDRTPDWLPWLRWVIVLAGVAAAGLVLAGPGWPASTAVARSRRARLALAAAPLGLALVAGLAGPAAYALDTVGTAHTGAIPSAGPPRPASAAVPAAGAASPVPGSPAALRPEPGRLEEPGPAGTGTPNGTGAPGGSSVQNGSGPPSGSAARSGTAAPGGSATPGGAQPGGTAGGGCSAAPGTVASAEAAGWAATPR